MSNTNFLCGIHTYTCVFGWHLKFFMTFKLKHLEILVMLSKFQSLKPWFVKRLKEWNTCTCRYHTKLNELRLGFNIMQVVGNVVHNQCVYSCENVCRSELNNTSSHLNCATHLKTYNTLSSLIMELSITSQS
jgi:hypothetical protein